MKGKIREVCIYRIAENGIIEPKVYYRDSPHEYCTNDWLGVLAFCLTLLSVMSLFLTQISAVAFVLTLTPLLCTAIICKVIQQRLYQKYWNELYLKTKTPEQEKLREDYLTQRENQIKTLETLKNTPIGKLTSTQKERMEELDYIIKYQEFR